MSVSDALAALVAELADNDIPDPLARRFPLACIWADLARIAGEAVPAEVAAILDAPAVHRLPVAEVRRWVPPGFDCWSDLPDDGPTISEILARCPHPKA